MNRTSCAIPCQAGHVSVWHPADLDAEALLALYGQRVGEGVLWLGHCIFVGLADDARCRDTGRVPLKTEYLRNCVGRHHLDAVRQAANEAWYVGRDGSYLAGERSQTYWILPPYDSAALVRREIRHAGLCHNIRKWLVDRRRAALQGVQRGQTLIAPAVGEYLWRNLLRVRIDERIDAADTPHPAHHVAIEQIREREFRFTVDDYGRVHTNGTNLSRRLRRYLSVDGKRLVNVDVCESQPLFMGLSIAAGGSHFPPGALAEGFSTRKQTRGKRTNQQSNNSDGTYHMLDSIMKDKNHQLAGEFNRTRLPSDLRRYLELCEQRGLYQTLADRLGTARDEAKKAILVVFFDKPWHRNALSAALEEMFPTVVQSMRRIKQDDYRELAHLAQRVESRFMFGRVVPRIMAMCPELFIATIHDSILTTDGNGAFVRQVMLDEFARLGLSPQVRVETLRK